MNRDEFEKTIARLEPDIALREGGLAPDSVNVSIAISLKRIADSLERHEHLAQSLNEQLSNIEMSLRK